MYSGNVMMCSSWALQHGGVTVCPLLVPNNSSQCCVLLSSTAPMNTGWDEVPMCVPRGEQPNPMALHSPIQDKSWGWWRCNPIFSPGPGRARGVG